MNVTFVDNVRERINKLKLQESYAGLVLGAIIVIVLGLLVANYFSHSAGQIGIGESISQQPTEFSKLQPKTYKVNAGDSLSAIAAKTYGSQDYWPVLAAANKIANPNLIYADTQLELPAIADAQKMKADLTMASYQVQTGDTLFLIAEKAYGDGSRWHQIAVANNVGNLPNGNPLIFAGSTLTIPRP